MIIQCIRSNYKDNFNEFIQTIITAFTREKYDVIYMDFNKSKCDTEHEYYVEIGFIEKKV